MSHRADEVRAVIWGVEVRLVSREAKGTHAQDSQPPRHQLLCRGPEGGSVRMKDSDLGRQD